jgi:RES domain
VAEISTEEFLKKEIAALEQIDRRSADIEELGARFRKIFDAYGCLTCVIDSQHAYRARRNFDRVPFEHVAEIWYPQPDKIKTLGRVNRAGQPMFYISASHLTATLEMRPQIGDVITLLSLKRKESGGKLHVMEIGLAEKQSLHGLDRSVRLLEETAYGQEFLKRRQGIERNLAIRSFLAREFTREVASGDEHEFKMTIAIAEFLLLSEQIDGLEYPSMAGDVSKWKGGANLALKPQSADRLFEPFECWMIEVEGFHPEPTPGLIVRCISKAKEVTLDGRIRWP